MREGRGVGGLCPRWRREISREVIAYAAAAELSHLKCMKTMDQVPLKNKRYME